jgi:hypothetical protein
MKAAARSPLDVIAVVFYLTVALAIGFADHRMRRFPEHVITNFMPGVLGGSYGAPDIYRPLSPWIFTKFGEHTGWTPLVSFLVLRGITIFGSLVATHLLLRTWFTAVTSLGVTLGVAALMPLTFTNSWAHPDTFVELLIFSLGCRAVARRQDAWFGVVLALGMLNRETTGFLTLLWAADRWNDRGRREFWLTAVSYATIVVGAYAGLRWLRGFQHYRYWMLPENLRAVQLLPAGFDPYLRIAGIFWLALLAVPAGLSIWTIRDSEAPSFMRASVMTAGALLIVSLMLAAIIEVRVLTPLFALLAPPVAWAVQRVDRSP